MDIFQDKSSGCQFCAPTNDENYTKMIKDGIPEFQLIKWCEQFLTKDGIFVDIGSSIGQYSILLSRKCKTIHAFEFQKNIFECLNVSICINNCFNIKPYNITLGSHQITSPSKDIVPPPETKIVQDPTPETKIVQEPVQVPAPEPASVQAPEPVPEHIGMRTLDSYNIEHIDFMKIKVDGYELEVMKGAEASIKRSGFPPFVFESVSYDWSMDKREALFEYIRSLGYVIHKISGIDNMYLASDNPSRPKRATQDPVMEELCVKHQACELDMSWNILYKLAQYYRSQGKYQLAYESLIKSKSLVSESEPIMALNNELSLIAHFIGKREEGLKACDEIILSHGAPWELKNISLHNQSYHMRKLPFTSVKPMKYNLPKEFIESSSAIIPHGDGFRMNMRAVNYSITANGSYIMRDPENKVRTQNYLLTLDANLNVLHGVELINNSGITLYPRDILGLEDIRLFGTNKLFCTDLEVNPHRVPQICHGRYDPDSGSITYLKPLMIGTELKCEKNWIPFVTNGAVHFVYTVQPLRLYKINPDNGDIELVRQGTLCENNIDCFRGSSSAISYKDGWLATIHQVFISNPRKYFHRFIWFNNEFTIIKYSDIFFFEAPGIEFNVSLCHSPTGLLVPFSRTDNCSRVGILPYNILDSMLKF